MASYLAATNVVGLCVQGTTLAVTDQGVGAAEGFEHGGGVFAGEGTGLVNVGVLGTVGDLAASGQLFNQTQKITGGQTATCTEG
jgi:hypothetical protein